MKIKVFFVTSHKIVYKIKSHFEVLGLPLVPHPNALVLEHFPVESEGCTIFCLLMMSQNNNVQAMDSKALV